VDPAGPAKVLKAEWKQGQKIGLPKAVTVIQECSPARYNPAGSSRTRYSTKLKPKKGGSIRNTDRWAGWRIQSLCEESVAHF
jgi:hypothetical protein